jgi:hypothetical protein
MGLHTVLTREGTCLRPSGRRRTVTSGSVELRLLQAEQLVQIRGRTYVNALRMRKRARGNH